MDLGDARAVRCAKAHLAETPSATLLCGYILSPPVTLGLCAPSWVLYEEPEFQGRKLFVPEGDMDLGASGTAWSTQGIGSLRRVVRVSGWEWAPDVGPSPPGPRP